MSWWADDMQGAEGAVNTTRVDLTQAEPLNAARDPRRERRWSRRVALARFSIGVLAKKHVRPGLHVRPRVAELFMTDNCNLKCVSCGCWRETTRHELTTDEWKTVIAGLADTGIVKMNFTGGEALIRKDIVRLIRHARECGVGDLHLNTNGILLTRAMVHEVLNAGIRSFNVSIDGPGADVHDAIRGRAGAFDRTMDHLRYLLTLRDGLSLRVRMNMTVLEPTVDQLEPMARLAMDVDVPLYLNLGTDQTFLFRHDAVGASIDVSEQQVTDGVRPLEAAPFALDERVPRPAELEYVKHFFGADSAFRGTAEVPCAESLLKVLVHSTGEIGGCWGEHLDFNVRTHSIADVLDSTEYRQEHRRLFAKDCVKCGSNYALNLRFEPRSYVFDLKQRRRARRGAA